VHTKSIRGLQGIPRDRLPVAASDIRRYIYLPSHQKKRTVGEHKIRTIKVTELMLKTVPTVHRIGIQYKLGVTVGRCLQNKALRYLMDCSMRTSDVSSRQRLRSANRHQLIPRHRRSTFGRRTLSVAGPMEWNSLPHSLRDPARSTDDFRAALKTSFCGAKGRLAH